MGSSESAGATSPRSERKGAPNLCKAVGDASSEISKATCCDMSSRFRSSERLFSKRDESHQLDGEAHNAPVCQSRLARLVEYSSKMRFHLPWVQIGGTAKVEALPCTLYVLNHQET